MNKTNLNERDIESAFLARSEGSPSSDLQDRISTEIRATRQRRALFVLPDLLPPAARRMAWVALAGAAALALLGIVAIGAGWRPNLMTTGPAPMPSSPVVALPSPSPTPAPSAAGPTPSASPATPRTFQVRFVSDDGISVTVDIDDQSGLVVDAAQGEPVDMPDWGVEDVKVANPPDELSRLRVEWVSPGGCHAKYGMTIEANASRIIVHTSYVVGGDSLGGNCGITLRFSGPRPASGIVAVMQNTPPTFGLDALTPGDTARVVATDGLRVRTAPGIGATSERLEPLLPADVLLLVVDGPIDADGYAWYRVAPCGSQAPYPSGWVAVASRLGEPWVERTTASCAPST